jgi:hypothetical protein
VTFGKTTHLHVKHRKHPFCEARLIRGSTALRRWLVIEVVPRYDLFVTLPEGGQLQAHTVI